MSNRHGTVPRDPIPAWTHPENRVPENQGVIRDIVHNGLRKLIASTTALTFLSPSVLAQGGSVPEEDRPVPICGSYENVEVDGQIYSRLVTENCEDYVVETTRSSGGGGLGIGLGVLAVAGLAAAAGGSGGGDGGNQGDNSNDNSNGNMTPSIPDPIPELTPRRQPRRSLLPPPGNPDNPASWRTGEFNTQYGLGLIGVEHRYAQGATGRGTLGAIYDTGLDLNHVDVGGIRLDLSHSYAGNPKDLSEPDGEGSGHGTHVYGIAGATRNGTGIHGVAPDAEFMFLKHGRNNRLREFIHALGVATNAGADAMNNSWVMFQRADSIEPHQVIEILGTDGIAGLRRSAQAGVSVVFATGNDSMDDPLLLAALPAWVPELTGTWIAATAIEYTTDLRSAGIADYANRCGTAMNWCLAAPGSLITSLKAGGDLATFSGTSAAAPHIMGAILVLKSQHPELTTPEIHRILFDTAVDLGAPGVDPVFGQGALNLGEAMTPQGTMTVELGSQVDESTVPLSASWIAESAITGGTLAAALSGQSVLVTDRYDRGYLASLGPRVVTGSFSESPDMQAGLAVAFSRVNDPWSDLPEAGFDLRFDAFGPDYDVTRIAHGDPVMGLISQTEGTGFSMRVPTGKATLSMASATTADGNAISLGAGLPFGEAHSVTVSLGHAQETDSLLGAKTHGAFAGLNAETVYGRVQTDVALGKRVTLNGSVTAGRTSFESTGLINTGKADTLGVAMGLTFNSALMPDDRLSLALAQPFAVSGGQMTLRGGTGISAAEAGQRTNRVSLGETTVPLGAADRAPELHLGYMHGFDAIGWADAALAFGGIARLDGGAKVAAARVALTFKF